MGKRGWIIFGVIAAVVLGGLIVVSQGNKLDVSGFDANRAIGANEMNGQIADHTLGNTDSQVILIEYGDYQCPGCASAAPNIKTITETYKDQLLFIFRNFPLTSIHPNARAAAATAEAAGLQGKYWEMHDALYANQNSWNTASTTDRTTIFRQYAGNLGINLDTFDTDVSSSAVNRKISFDQALFKATGKPQSTPTFILNGKLVDQYVKDGEVVSSTTEGAEPIWSDSDAFKKYVLLPAFTEKGISVPETSDAS